MSFDLIREKIVLDQKLGEESTQVLLETDIIVPDIKPDIAVILQTDAKVLLDDVNIANEKINFAGEMNVNVLYLAKNAEKPVHSMNVSIPVADFLNFDGVKDGVRVDIDWDIAHKEYKLINDRKISFKVVIFVKAAVNDSFEKEIVTDIHEVPEIQIKRRPINICRNLENKEDRFIVKDELIVPSGKPNIKEILKTAVKIADKEIKISEGKVSVKGSIVITTLYVGDMDESIVELTEHEVPFNGAIEMRDAREGMEGDVKLTVGNEYISPRSDQDGEDRMLAVEITINAKVDLSVIEEFEMIEDAYYINKQLNFVKDEIKYPKLICVTKNQSTFKETLKADDKCPDILQIFNMTGKIKLDEVKILDDKVAIEGVIAADIIYVAKSDETPLYSFAGLIPFKQIIDSKDARGFMRAEISPEIEHAGFNLLSDKEVEARFIISFNVKVMDENMIELISDIELNEMDRTVLDNMASMTIYVVQPGDTLWRIAKKYNTSVDELAALNEIENPDKIYPGQKLLILKKVLD